MRRAVALVIAVALGLAPAAAAKGPISVRACGASGCKSTLLQPPFRGDLAIPAYDTRGGQSQPPPQAAPWFDVRFRLSGSWRRIDDRCQIPRPRLPQCYPKRHVFALADGSYAGGRDLPRRVVFWQRLSPAEERFYAKLTRGVDPLPAATMPGLGAAETGGSGETTWWPFAVVVGILVVGAAAVGLRRVRRHSWLKQASRQP